MEWIRLDSLSNLWYNEVQMTDTLFNVLGSLVSILDKIYGIIFG